MHVVVCSCMPVRVRYMVYKVDYKGKKGVAVEVVVKVMNAISKGTIVESERSGNPQQPCLHTFREEESLLLYVTRFPLIEIHTPQPW